MSPPPNFIPSLLPEPHIARRKAILAAHPEIEKLYGNDTRVVPYVVALVLCQITFAVCASSMSWTVFLLLGWIVGGAFSHSLSLMAHETSHNLVFETPSANIYFGIFCNMGTGMPSATTFKKYHLEHHLFQGNEGIDVDLPTVFEGNFFYTPLRKFFFLLCQSIVYAVRPCIVRPKNMAASDIANYVVVIGFDIFLIYFFGFASFGFLLYSLFMGMGLHPVAGHFIGEHYIFAGGPKHDGLQNSHNVKSLDTFSETYSYYGPLNILCWNVGYHNEHHDFPRVPGWRLPLVKEIAPEFYCDLPCHESWTMVLVNFIFDNRMSPFNRVVRQPKGSDKGKSQ
jgi:sphingolipid delta-4 desaturase